jgi:hypothetical protein
MEEDHDGQAALCDRTGQSPADGHGRLMGNLAFVRRRENSHARQTLAKMGMAFTAEKTKLASALTQKRAAAIGKEYWRFPFSS